VPHMGASEPVSGPEQAWKVGSLAKATGLTVRALHHYDRIGLLNPSRRKRDTVSDSPGSWSSA
jgi:hypothetical protein